MALDLPAIFEGDLAGAAVVAQVNAGAVSPEDVPGAWVIIGAIADDLVQLVDVVWCDNLGIGENSGDAAGDADLVERQIGVASDDSSCREIDTLAHQVA